ncbi:MAG: 30S ribosomal protein S2 [Gammaproteobacteria bacterium RIFCSPLOWO2_02_FULL_42_14]|nr:MAG: 30S ribosomal protein S2 [Gammaproteobacteria bacterium RIFCSPHIGHO2_02_FULL_42_43]OGT27426.1 MAG: 30S ribosomal protein S2 [Gammaproteobacteria bacterium RIFCSPHIGHO2_01_FULL_42_8]OGT52365.1 MAG: 30S ribosomal protein S2 [Gammaproteobacteria bacterium RIFCSPHIGHO2_12_FULL_41_25]OGT63345.1 MAG: 30S ribosomal protein S2 [Gammaproteobacteria bacterium RIFCSPLOWO2_02_FULL_42_14]OGT86312.1 MAG: 30S ribosomal protein S2 [Gammaproteobacteria bacterium RIFCSPLOWO2_12_FULL_42_18]
MTISISMRDLLEAGVHFGHQKRFWNPKMAPFIFSEREKTHIINLEETLPKFRGLLDAIHQITSKRGKVMFVGTKHAATDIVKEEGIRCGMPYVNRRWLGGMLTNYKTIRQSIKRLKDLEAMLENTKLLALKTKKEVLMIQREKDKLAVNLDGIKNMGGLPDMLFVIDVKREKIAISEAQRLGIPVAAIVDTNASPDGIDYVVPGNDDAIRAIRFYCKTIADVIIESRRSILEEDAAKEKERAERAKAKAKPKAPLPEIKKVKKEIKESDVSAEMLETEVVVVEMEAQVETVAEVEASPAEKPAKKSTAKKAKQNEHSEK